MLPREENGIANEKRVSKAEVLILAKKHIEELEREKRELEEENVGLEETVIELKKRWVNLGGVCMP
jgi:predicted nuclease with TOPRIM domain